MTYNCPAGECSDGLDTPCMHATRRGREGKTKQQRLDKVGQRLAALERRLQDDEGIVVVLSDDESELAVADTLVGFNRTLFLRERAERRGAAVAAVGDRLRAALAAAPPMSDGAMLGRPSLVILDPHLGAIVVPTAPGRV